MLTNFFYVKMYCFLLQFLFLFAIYILQKKISGMSHLNYLRCTYLKNCLSIIIFGSIISIQEYYLSILRRFYENIRYKILDLLKNNSWILHYDNTLSDKSCFVCKFLTKTSTNVVINQTPYSPDMTPCNYFLHKLVKQKNK